MKKKQFWKQRFFNLEQLFFIGVDKNGDEHENNKIVILNTQNFWSVVVLIISIFIYCSIGYYVSALASFCIILPISISFYLVHKKKYLRAKLFIFLYYNSTVLFGAIYFSHPALNYYYIPVIMASIMVFQNNELKYLILVVTVSISLMLIQTTPLTIYIPKFYADKTPEHSTLAIFLILALYVTGLLSVFILYTNLNFRHLLLAKQSLIKSGVLIKKQSIDTIVFSEASNQFLKSPILVLNIFIGKIEKGIEEGKGYAELKEYFDIIQSSIANEEIFINNMFKYNKIITTTVKKTNFSLDDFFNQLKKRVVQKYNIVTINIEQCNSTIETDENLLTVIFDELFENAVTYNNTLHPVIKVSFENTLTPFLTINVIDNGIGINENFRQNIFQPFIRLNVMKRIDGSGLGLAKAIKATELLDSFLTNEDYNGGAHFKLVLKIA